jgi:hypothetical protein
MLAFDGMPMSELLSRALLCGERVHSAECPPAASTAGGDVLDPDGQS